MFKWIKKFYKDYKWVINLKKGKKPISELRDELIDVEYIPIFKMGTLQEIRMSPHNVFSIKTNLYVFEIGINDFQLETIAQKIIGYANKATRRYDENSISAVDN